MKKWKREANTRKAEDEETEVEEEKSLRTKKNRLIAWVKAHKKELAIAEVSVLAWLNLHTWLCLLASMKTCAMDTQQMN